MPRAVDRLRGALRARLERYRLLHLVGFVALWSVLFVQALTLPLVLLVSDSRYREELERDVRRIVVAVTDAQNYPSAAEIARRGAVLVDKGVIAGGVVHDMAGSEVGAFGQRPLWSPSEAVAEGLTWRVDSARGVLELYLAPQETHLAYGIVVSASLSALHDAAGRQLWRSTEVALAVALGSALILTALLWAWVVRPVVSLRDAAVAAMRDPDVADRHQLGWTRGDELGEMSRALDRLFKSVSVVYQEDLAAAQEVIEGSGVAIVQYGPVGETLSANAAALALFGVAGMEEFQALGPSWIRLCRSDGRSAASVAELAEEGGQIRLRTVRTPHGDKVCLVHILTVRRSDGGVLRVAASLVDLTPHYDFVRRLEQELESTRAERDGLLRSSLELKQLFESCSALLESVMARGERESKMPHRPAAVSVDQIVDDWFREAIGSRLVQERVELAVLPQVQTSPPAARAVFRQALLLVYLCSTEARPLLGVTAEVADGRAVFTVREIRTGQEPDMERTGNWALAFGALRAALAEASGQMLAFARDDAAVLRFTLPASQSGHGQIMARRMGSAS